MKALSVPCPECDAAIGAECTGTFLFEGHAMLHLARVAALMEEEGGDRMVALVDAPPTKPEAVTLHERLLDIERFAPHGIYDHNPDEVCAVVAEWLREQADGHSWADSTDPRLLYSLTLPLVPSMVASMVTGLALGIGSYRWWRARQ